MMNSAYLTRILTNVRLTEQLHIYVSDGRWIKNIQSKFRKNALYWLLLFHLKLENCRRYNANNYQMLLTCLNQCDMLLYVDNCHYIAEILLKFVLKQHIINLLKEYWYIAISIESNTIKITKLIDFNKPMFETQV